MRFIRFFRHLDRSFYWLFIGLLLVFGVPLFLSKDSARGTGQAVLTLSGPTSSITIGESFHVLLTMHSTISVNAVGFVLKYDPKILTIEQMSTAQSFCSFYPDNSFDNIKGEVHLSCGAPNPGFIGDSVLLDLTMHSKTNGTSNITLDPATAQILANDGKGTNLINKVPKLDVAIIQTF